MSPIEVADELSTYKLSREFRGKSRRLVSGEFSLARVSRSNIYVAVTSDKQSFVKRVMMKFFEDSFSECSRLHITSTHIQGMLDRVKGALQCEIVTDRTVSYSRLDNRKTVITGRPHRIKESDLRWTEEDYKETFIRASENNQWIDRISFYALKDKRMLFYATLSREGMFNCNRDVGTFFRIVVSQLSDVGEKNTGLFSHKSRNENKGEIRPISISYRVGVFDDVEQNRRLANVISTLPRSSASVYHGNPYLHMSLVDYLDGSSYDVWVVSTDRLIIIPQLRATFSSISRVCEHILKRFLEGEISEFTTRE